MKKLHKTKLYSVPAVLLTSSIFTAGVLAAQPSKMTVELAKVMPVSAQPTTSSAVGALYPNVIVAGHHLVTSQFHKYGGIEIYTELDGTKTTVGGTFSDVSLAHYSFNSWVVDGSGTVVTGTLDYGAFDFDMMSKKKSWLTEKTFSSREIAWTNSKFSNTVNDLSNPYHHLAPAYVPKNGCKFEDTPGHELPLPSNPTDEQRTSAEQVQGNVFVPAFEAYVQHKNVPFEYSLNTGLLKVTIGDAVHEWKIAEKFTERWEMTQNIYNSNNPSSRRVGDRIWGGADNSKPRAFGYMSESLNPVPQGSAKLRDHFYYTDPATSVATSKGYYGSNWSTAATPDRADVGSNVALHESEWSFAPFAYLEPKDTSGNIPAPYSDDVYSNVQQGCSLLNGSNWCDSHIALNVLRPRSNQYQTLEQYPGMDSIHVIQNGLESSVLLQEQLPVVPTQADGSEIPNFSSLIYRTGGHGSDPRIKTKIESEQVMASTCRSRWNSFRRGHAYMNFGAWKDGKFANFVGVEQVYEGDGYPYMSVTHSANSEWSTKFAENTLRDMTGTVDPVAVAAMVKYTDKLDDRSKHVYATMDNTKFKARMGVNRLYHAMFNRVADKGGLLSWSGHLESGMPLEKIAEYFSQSSEFSNIYGNLSHTDFVKEAYRKALGREADAEGLAYFTQQLNDGLMTKARVLVIMTESDESIGKYTYRGQVELLHHLLPSLSPGFPEPTELSKWAQWEQKLITAAAVNTAALEAETKAMIDEIIASDEYTAP